MATPAAAVRLCQALAPAKSPPLEVQADEVVPSADLPWIDPDGPLVMFPSLSGPSQPKEAIAPEERVVSRATEGILPVMKVSLFPF